MQHLMQNIISEFFTQLVNILKIRTQSNQNSNGDWIQSYGLENNNCYIKHLSKSKYLNGKSKCIHLNGD